MAPTTAIPFREKKILTFDVYGTLIDCETGIHEILLSSALGPHLPSSRTSILLGFDHYEDDYHKTSPSMSQSSVLKNATIAYAKSLNLVPSKISEAELDKVGEDVAQSMSSWPAFPDTVAAMQTLGKYYKLAPLSNTDSELFSGTCSGPLKGVKWDAVYLAQDIGSYKPDLRNFEYLIEHVGKDFGFGKEEIMQVANSVDADIVPCREIGITSVWVDRRGVTSNVQWQNEGSEEEMGFAIKVHSLGELAEIVEKARRA